MFRVKYNIDVSSCMNKTSNLIDPIVAEFPVPGQQTKFPPGSISEQFFFEINFGFQRDEWRAREKRSEVTRCVVMSRTETHESVVSSVVVVVEEFLRVM